MSLCQFDQLAPDCILVCPNSIFEFDPHTRLAIHADQCGAIHQRMDIENALDLFCEQHIVIRDHTMRFSSAIPQPSLFVEITNIAYAVDDSILMLDFG